MAEPVIPTLSMMMSDVAMELAHELVPPELDRYIMTRVREKMSSDHGYVLDATVESSEFEKARRQLHDELLRSVAHKEREANNDGNVSLALDCEAARRAITKWAALG